MQESNIKDDSCKRTVDNDNKDAKKVKTSDENGDQTCCCHLSQIYKNLDDSTLKENNENFETLNVPFKCHLFRNFIQENDFLQSLRKELMEDVDYHLKNNDLYSFRQSDDFKNISFPNTTAIRSCLLNEARKFLSHVTSIELFDDIIDITASKYEYNDVLLCHDDQLEGRRIAFILYLTPDWSESDGGLLNIFDHDDNKQPTKVIKSIVPEWNTFVCFEVTPVSFHTVSEVFSKEKCRLTVNGWFRGPGFQEASPYIEQYVNVKKCGDINVSQEVFTTWVNPMYLKSKYQRSIQRKFVKSSEISLPDFLNEEKFEQVSRLLGSDHLSWKFNLPPNKRRFEVLNEECETPEILTELINVFQSEAMFLTLSNFTGLKLHPLAENDDSSDEDENDSECNPRCRLQVRKWSKGCYTLVHDYDPEVMDNLPKLDLNICFNHDFEANQEFGGFTSYITKGSDETLLCVEPASNCLSIVYMDGETVRFVKYLNDSFDNVYQDLNLTFQE
ncbi:prolyl 3-hydroxylase OGFOD1-like protein [Leptotrombidium deliense]|uniref:uS12 prolyl 3-hydroxylase n=1 Tax=Leptotrombidium deliense TaxID=299467 RepID=A0A443S970_9ACAR|nr:prolyl 3-hydroxylase OGFOD1-like protein [Leptotrombidium deliense]